MEMVSVLTCKEQPCTVLVHIQYVVYLNYKYLLDLYRI